ncbi:GNAT family N-acetyltransferase [Noviherbaspirillum saxi]|uniref:GNAT family N-acetyltransferase n=1 Tax=Noviherbaspirillum saxi TaxID=2320863 RepID=A0A3A3G6Q7_9BURK|nr:GNAT family N-acetyltransferase [Noviherbaspirillum saxi]RJF95870.1 GNAT family N-acetyltransferase [Noviherbaspirillum saxi]
MSAKELYRQLTATETSIPIFSRSWWLDATAGSDGWDVALVQYGSEIHAAMPYMVRRRFGMTVLSQPALTQALGPWLRPGDPNTSEARRLAREKELMQKLIDQLPKFDYFSQNWHYHHTNWLPFFWRGFKQTTRYTYVITDLRHPHKLWSAFQGNVRRNCNTATQRYHIVIRDDLPIEDFISLNRMTFQRQGLSVPYSDDYLRRLDAACAERSCRKYYIAIDPEGRHHAGCYIVWDENSAYGLINGSDPTLRHSGALSLCFWHAIQDAAQVTQRFDFEGSVLEPVERFVRCFGATQIPYFNISKAPAWMSFMRDVMHTVRSQ